MGSREQTGNARWRRSAAGKGPFDPLPSFTKMATVDPEVAEGSYELEHLVVLVTLVQPGEGLAEIRQLALQPAAPPTLIWALEDGGRLFGKRHIVGGMTMAGRRLFLVRRQLLRGEFPDRLKHSKSGVVVCALDAPYEMAVQETAQSAEDIERTVRSCDRLRGLEGPATDKDAELPEERLLCRGQELVT